MIYSDNMFFPEKTVTLVYGDKEIPLKAFSVEVKHGGFSGMSFSRNFEAAIGFDELLQAFFTPKFAEHVYEQINKKISDSIKNDELADIMRSAYLAPITAPQHVIRSQISHMEDMARVRGVNLNTNIERDISVIKYQVIQKFVQDFHDGAHQGEMTIKETGMKLFPEYAEPGSRYIPPTNTYTVISGTFEER